MEYLKVFTDFVEVIETLGEAERGRLFTAMLKYAGQGVEPDFRGNERFVWPIAKQNIDRTVVEHEKHIAAKREAGLKGAAKRWQAMANDGSAISANSKNGENGYLKDKDKDKDNYYKPYSPLKEQVDGFVADLSKVNGLKVPDNARKAQEAVASYLETIGFDCRLEIPVENRGDGKAGRIDIVAIKDGMTAAIEIDRGSVREKSVFKLSQMEGAIKVAIVRDGEVQSVPGVDLVLSLKTDRTDKFDCFWAEYPKKVAKNEAKKAFAKLNPTEDFLSKMLETLKWQKKSDQWTKDGGQYIPNPATWLNQKRWEDEPTVSVKTPKKDTSYDMDLINQRFMLGQIK